jgi:hypothetical protein
MHSMLDKLMDSDWLRNDGDMYPSLDLVETVAVAAKDGDGAGGAAGSSASEACGRFDGDSEEVRLDDAAPSSVLIVLPRLNDSGHALPVHYI